MRPAPSLAAPDVGRTSGLRAGAEDGDPEVRRALAAAVPVHHGVPPGADRWPSASGGARARRVLSRRTGCPNRLKYLAGSEAGAGVFTADTLPEDKARSCGGRGARLSDDRAVMLDAALRSRCSAVAPIVRQRGLRPREPDRRAHRLQRRLRAADLDSPAHRSRHSAARRIATSASGAASSAPRRRRRAVRSRRRAPTAVVGRLRAGRARRRSRAPASTSADSISRFARPCRSAAACRRAPRCEVAILRGLRDLFGLTLDDVTLAKLGQRAEIDFVGAPVGIMDQMASSLAQPGVALFIDTRSLAYEQVRAAGRHGAGRDQFRRRAQPRGGDYRTRRAECERAPALLGVAALRDLAARDAGARAVAAGADQPPRAPCGHREPARARRRGRDAPRRRHGARPPVQRVARLAARRLRSVRARGRSAGDAGRSRARRSRRAAHRRRLRRIDRGAGARAAKPPASPLASPRSMAKRVDRVATVLVPQPATELAAEARRNSPRRLGEHGESSENHGFRRVFVLPSLPMPARLPGRDQPELLPAGFANPAEQVALVRKPTGAAREQALSLALERFGAARLTERADDPDGWVTTVRTLPAVGGALRAVARADRPAPARGTRGARHRAALHAPGRRARASPSPAATSSSPRRPPRARRSVTTRRC